MSAAAGGGAGGGRSDGGAPGGSAFGGGRSGAEALAAFLAELHTVAAAALAPDGRVLEGNRGFWRLLGDEAGWLAGPGAPWCLQPSFEALTARAEGEADAGGVDYRGRVTLGDPRGAGRTVHASFGRYGEGWLLVGELDVADEERLAERVMELNRDLSEGQRELARANRLLRRREEELVRLSHTDALTGIPNRRSIMERLVQEVARSRRSGEPLSLAMIDLDDFKGVNDGGGHATGDRVLQGVAAKLRAGLRPYDVAGRLGGDEFVLLLPGADAETARAVCERVLAALATVGRAGTEPHQEAAMLRASVGVATLPSASAGARDGADGSAEADVLLRRADRVLYGVKRAGGGRVRVEGDSGES